MSTDMRLLRSVMWRWRTVSLVPFVGLALTAAAFTVAGKLFDWPTWPGFIALGFAALAALLDRQWRITQSTLCTKLDGRYPELQDSAALLLQREESLGPLAQLQRQRTAATLARLAEAGQLRTLHPPLLRSPLLAAIGACLGLVLYVAMRQLAGADFAPGSVADADSPPGNDRSIGAIVEAVTDIEPPAYTGLPARRQSLNVAAPERSQITWHLRLEAPAFGVQMVAAHKNFSLSSLDPLPSRRWTLTRTLHETDFYQLSLLTNDAAGEGADYVLLPDIYNIEIKPDRPPEFAFDYPRDNVTVVNVAADKQASLLNVSVQVSDDFAVTSTDLMLTLASGSGENVRFRNERIHLKPSSSSEDGMRYRFTIPAQRYDIEPGDELYWHLESRDNRTPDANVQKSQHFIVRWPQEEIFGLSDAEGMAIKILPEYFRSQRQLIIDTEALLEDKAQISTAEFRKRSEGLAYEQNLLRMRYGRFLGEEDSGLEHGGEHGSEHDGEHGDEHRGEAEAEGHTESHAEDHDGSSSGQRFGDATGVVAAVGHQHDSSEHATLFDPKTKELLRSALNAMWSAWRDLSVIEPRDSLPDQHAALRYIKEVQQASRIYLQRVGFDAPALDETRRLSGEHKQVAPPKVSAERQDRMRQHLLVLLDALRNGAAVDDGAEVELQQLPALREDSATRVELAKQMRRYRQQPTCADCRRQLASLLYQLLPAAQAEPALPLNQAKNAEYGTWLRNRAQGEE